MLIKVKKLDAGAKLPTGAYDHPAGYDLYALEGNDFIYGNSLCKIRTGIALEIPTGYVGLICDKSGVSSKGLKVYGGVIDSDYRGEIIVMLGYMADRANRLQIKRGEKVAQILFIKVEQAKFEECDVLGDTNRGDKGFGSSSN